MNAWTATGKEQVLISCMSGRECDMLKLFNKKFTCTKCKKQFDELFEALEHAKKCRVEEAV